MKIKNESYFTVFMMVISFAAAAYAITQWDFKTVLVPALCGCGTFILCSFQFFYSVFFAVFPRAQGKEI
jgi:hypothetical protein